MTLTPITGTVTDPISGATFPTLSIQSTTPFYFVRYNTTTKAILGTRQTVFYSPGSVNGELTVTGGIIACDTYANLQAAVAAAGLTGTLSADPTPTP